MKRTLQFHLAVLAGLVLLLVGLSTSMVAQTLKVEVCHIPPTNPPNFHTITISETALQAHLDHGDKFGACGLFAEVLCDDGDECTIDAFFEGTESCILPIAARDPTDCDDGDRSTADSCDSIQGCINEQRADECPCFNIAFCDPNAFSCRLDITNLSDLFAGQSCDVVDSCDNFFDVDVANRIGTKDFCVSKIPFSEPPAERHSTAQVSRLNDGTFRCFTVTRVPPEGNFFVNDQVLDEISALACLAELNAYDGNEARGTVQQCGLGN